MNVASFPRFFRYQTLFSAIYLLLTDSIYPDNFHTRIPTAHQLTIVRSQTEVDSTIG